MLSERAASENRTVTNMADTLLRESLRWPTIKEDEPKPSARVVSSASPGKQTATLKTQPNPNIDLVKSLFPKAQEVCKVHGTPMTAQGKCLQKGCKYA